MRSKALALALGGVLSLAIVAGLGAVQVASMSAYGDLAARPSLPAFLHATNPARLHAFVGGSFARAAALAHTGDVAGADALLARMPEDRRTDDLHGDIALRRGNLTPAFRWYLRAGDESRAQAIVGVLAAGSPRQGLAAQAELVRSLEGASAPSDTLADAWLRLGQLQREDSDSGAGVADARAALQSFEKAVALAPNRKSYLLAAGIQAMKLGDFTEADVRLSHAADVGPTGANTFGVLALVHAAERDCGRARTDLAQWRARSGLDVRAPWEDPQLGAPLRACMRASTTARGSVPARASAPANAVVGRHVAAAAKTAPPQATPTRPAAVAETSAAPAPAPTEFSIVSVDVSTTTVSSYTQISGTVTTSDDAISVLASVPPLPPLRIPKLGPRTFGLTGQVPWLPPFVHGTYIVTFTAYDGRGHQASTTRPFLVR